MSKIVFASTRILLSTVVAEGPAYIIETPSRVFQASMEQGDSATVVLEVSLDGVHFVELATIALTAAAKSAGFVSAAPWRYVRARVSAIGANGLVSVYAGV